MKPNEACHAMHTALRKQCDSKITSLLYNAIRIIHFPKPAQDPWIYLGQLVVEKLEELNPRDRRTIPHAALISAAQQFQTRWQDRRGEAVDYADCWVALFTNAFALFSAEDYKGMAEYLKPEYQNAEG